MPLEGGQLSNNKVCSGHSSNRCANNSNNNNGNNNNNVGGPLMSVTHLNGQVSGISGRGLTPQGATTSNSVTFSTSESCNPLNSLSSSNPFNHFSGNMDLEFELFPSSTWDLDNSSGWVERPESRASGPPNSRPPSQPAAASPSPQGTFSSNSAVTSHCSPLRAFSPTTGNPAHPFSNSFPFSPLQETQTSLNNVSGTGGNVNSSANGGPSTSKRVIEDVKGCPSTSGTMSSAPNTPNIETQNSVVSTESGRLRNLLTKGASGSEDSQDNSNNDSQKQNKHKILKTLLNQQDEDDYHSEHNTRVRTSPNNAPKQNTEQSNNMLLQVMNFAFLIITVKIVSN